MASTGWDAQQDHHMTSAGDDDFQQFLDMSGMGGMQESMQFDFAAFPDGTSQNLLHDQSRVQAPEVMMPGSATTSMLTQPAAIMPAQASTLANPVGHAQTNMIHAGGGAADNQNDISDIDAQIQYLQQQKFHQQQRHMQEQRAAFYRPPHGHSVPPTPQSFEMPPGSGQFFSPAIEMQQNGSYEGGFQHRAKEHQDMSFTPLVSPAVTPHFTVDSNFTVPGAYFSPLTSPALRAQTDNSSLYDHSTRSNNSPSEQSPVNIDNAMVVEQQPPPAPQGTGIDLSRKARKNNAAKASRAKPSVRSSPISKPLRKKTGPSPAMMSQVLTEVEERNLTDNSMLPLPAATSTDGSEDASVSPENLTDMPPPPVPARRSNSKSPYIHPQHSSTSTTMATSTPVQTAVAGPVSQLLGENSPLPATPASLMRLASSKNKRTPTEEAHDPTSMDNIETLELGESVSNRDAAQNAQKKQPVRIDTSLAAQASSGGPQSSKTPTSRMLASPSGRSGSFSATQSPQLRPGTAASGSSRKTPQLAAKSGRKGSVQVSPALLPRISPNIKPLLPSSSGMSVEDTASRLLTSKSNYQNILEGNSVPGVSYPSELSTNLTSKRTSHKIAEQGRRNRINSALQIMASLLPEGGEAERAAAAEAEEEAKKESKAASAANSKASVVENAIVHMKSLKQENADLKVEVQTLRKQLEELQSSPAT